MVLLSLLLIVSVFVLKCNLQSTANTNQSQFVLNFLLFNTFLLFKIRIFICKGDFYYQVNGHSLHKIERKKDQAKKNSKIFHFPSYLKFPVYHCRLNFIYGKRDDAASTALVCAGIKNIVAPFIVHNPIFNIWDYDLKVIPAYDRDIAKLNLEVGFYTNVLLIIFNTLRILLAALKKGESKWKKSPSTN